MCEQNPYIRCGFHAGAKATRYSVEIALTSAKGLLEMTLSLTYPMKIGYRSALLCFQRLKGF